MATIVAMSCGKVSSAVFSPARMWSAMFARAWMTSEQISET